MNQTQILQPQPHIYTNPTTPSDRRRYVLLAVPGICKSTDSFSLRKVKFFLNRKRATHALFQVAVTNICLKRMRQLHIRFGPRPFCRDLRSNSIEPLTRQLNRNLHQLLCHVRQVFL